MSGENLSTIISTTWHAASTYLGRGGGGGGGGAGDNTEGVGEGEGSSHLVQVALDQSLKGWEEHGTH